MNGLGVFVIIALSALSARLVVDVGNDPQFISMVSSYSPFIGEHTVALGWIAAVMLLVAGILIPRLIVVKDIMEGRERIGLIGSIAGSASIIYVVVTVAAPFVCYLVSMALYFIKNNIGA